VIGAEKPVQAEIRAFSEGSCADIHEKLWRCHGF
jgi:hypothetical protein